MPQSRAPSTDVPRSFVMFTEICLPLAVSVNSLVRDATNELTTYSGQMTTYHWGVVAGCAVAFGFLCLKGTGLNR